MDMMHLEGKRVSSKGTPAPRVLARRSQATPTYLTHIDPNLYRPTGMPRHAPRLARQTQDTKLSPLEHNYRPRGDTPTPPPPKNSPRSGGTCERETEHIGCARSLEGLPGSVTADG